MFGKVLLLLCCLGIGGASLGAPVWTSVQADAFKLPANLTEVETKLILKEQAPKSHVMAVIQVATQRLSTAAKLSESGGFEATLQALNVYADLYEYADAYARRLPESAKKDRAKCLKEIEQAIFKQNRPFEAVRRELPLEYRETTDPLVEDLKRIRLRALNDVIGGGTFIK